MSILYSPQLKNVIWGATLMGGGGGGSIQNGLDLLRNYEREYGEARLELITYDEMEPGLFAAVTAGMGSPAAIAGIDFTPYAVNAYNLLEMIARASRKELRYGLPVELGGFNTFVPMLISMLKKTPFIDADGSGRAVPALETLLLNINGCATSPLALSNADNDKVTIQLSNPYDAVLCEKLGRDVCVEFGNQAGLSGWIVNSDEIGNRLPTGTITLCEKIGAICRKVSPDTIFKEIKANTDLDVKQICIGYVVKVETKTEGGFDYGYVIVDGANGEGRFRIDFQNENLLLSRMISETRSEPIMTVPDITCMNCVKSVQGSPILPGMPISNADVREGMIIGLGVIRVNEKWEKTPAEHMWSFWKPYMDVIGYTGGRIPFDKVPFGI